MRVQMLLSLLVLGCVLFSGVDAASKKKLRVILDAGSSGVKTMFFACEGAVCPAQTNTECSAMKVQNIVDLTATAEVTQAYVTYVSGIVAGTGGVPEGTTVFVNAYATAGNRIITTVENLATWRLAYEEAVKATDTHNTVGGFQTLHGTEEAMVEYLAISYWIEGNNADLVTTAESRAADAWLNMISLGGASAQLAIDLDTNEKVAKFTTLVRWAHANIKGCNVEKDPEHFVAIAHFESAQLPRFIVVPFASIDSVSGFCYPKDKTGIDVYHRCVGFISFLGGQFNSRKEVNAEDAQCIKDLHTTVKTELVKSVTTRTWGWCRNHVWAGFDQVEAMFKYVFADVTFAGGKKGNALTGAAADWVGTKNFWLDLLEHDCMALQLRALLTEPEFKDIAWKAAGTMRTAITIAPADAFRGVLPLKDAYLDFLGIRCRITGADNSGDWTLGIAKVFKCHNLCKLPKNGDANGKPNCAKTIVGALLEQLADEIEMIL